MTSPDWRTDGHGNWYAHDRASTSRGLGVPTLGPVRVPMVPHGLAAAVLLTLTGRDRWIDEDELIDLVRCQYSEALNLYPNDGANAADIVDAASGLASANLIEENPVHGISEVQAGEDYDGSTFYAWRIRRG